MLIAEIAQPVPLRRTFEYEIPSGLKDKARPGARVRAPFGPSRRLIGMILSVREGSSERKLKLIEDVVDEEPVLTAELMELARWMSRRTCASIGECVKALVPSFIHPIAVSPASSGDKIQVAEKPGAFELTPGQVAAFAGLHERLKARTFSTALLYGVPASGKTEVYLRLMHEALAMGGQVLYLLPEIALTKPFFEELSRRAGVPTALWHSRLGIRERRSVWMGLRSGEIRVVVGARSACLLPFKDLRLAVIDEEQDESYKQEGQAPLYHARDLVMERARRLGALVVLGSATPSMETMAMVEAGALALFGLPQRVSGRDLGPKVEVIDKPPRPGSCISEPLLAQIRDRLGRREQVILLINRRGFSNFLLCRKCGWVARCPVCNLAYIHHQAKPGQFDLRCHHCGRQERVPDRCGSCKVIGVAMFGVGTQKIESEIRKLLPGARVLRMDRDTVSKDKPHDSPIYDEFKAGKADILVGTKLAAKGYHFPEVTLVGVVDADTMLLMPDFRCAERTVQLLFQVGGRAGRAEKPGEVLVQSAQPGHYAIQAAARGDYLRFARQELDFRRQLSYPPFSTLIRAIFSGKNEAAVTKAADSASEAWRAAVSGDYCEILGPAPAVYHKLRGRYRYHLLAKVKDEARLEEVLAKMSQTQAPSGVRIAMNVDPYDLF